MDAWHALPTASRLMTFTIVLYIKITLLPAEFVKGPVTSYQDLDTSHQSFHEVQYTTWFLPSNGRVVTLI